jgi:molybdopterin/thiamine biosynthesis adenylyltransferase/DNA-directed RNA polymerase subunit RPC12/RpoP
MSEIEILVHGPTAAGEPTARQVTTPIDLDLREDRYSRLRQIPWWDQERLRNARILVVGAGAIGNEVIKMLALLGIGEIFVIDMDLIEDTNLTRSVLFRAADIGQSKAQVAARRAREINPDVSVFALHGNVVTDIGLGFFASMNVVVGALDNREARVAVNQACSKVGRPWVDGAIEVLSGVARVFAPPEGACYECTMSRLDYQLLSVRKSCALLRRKDVLEGKIPTTPTTAAIIAGVQVQEVLKLLHDRADLLPLTGRGFVFNGATHDSYTVTYDRRDDCPSHVSFQPAVPVDASSALSFASLLELARPHLADRPVLSFDREMIVALRCIHCGTEVPHLNLLDRISPEEAACPGCGADRFPVAAYECSGTEPWADRLVREAGFPPWDIFPVTDGAQQVYLELTGDREGVYKQWREVTANQPDSRT